MREPRIPATPGTGGGSGSGFGAVTIDFKPGPDARDRLRRLYSLLLEHADDDGATDCGEDGPASEPAVDGGAAE